MTRVEPFGKVAERFAIQQEKSFCVRFLVRFPQAFITSLFRAFLKLVPPFQKVVKSPPSAEKIEPPSYLLSRIPTERNALFIIVLPQTSNSSNPGIEPAILELEGKRSNHYTEQGCARWDRWFVKSLSTSILWEWFLKRFAPKFFRGQPMESEMATFSQPSLLSGRSSYPHIWVR
ncbi:hypothetical protein AVEN_241168-1 [Araneus ventricosus]|uniref:Uncharacterized protein n=1 Tax=Araneus ventricosus TaxID=182803 RepID=A0A4Y2G2S3_ARAVE|nr:hypothetical protein AVEN_241168-1 [Araneus ventricosus]